MRSRLFALAPVVAFTLLVSCGDDLTEQSSDTTAAVSPTLATLLPEPAPTTTTIAKPTVDLPKILPTELVVTDLTEGTGAAAAVGDLVVLNYLGVLSKDGTEFDNSYDEGEPLSIALGTGQVIQGWDEGLVGVKQGGRRQLDIPSALAYGDTDRGEIIKAGDALTFIVDVVAVIPAVDPADAPEITLEGAANVSELSFDDLVAGTGEELAAGRHAVVQLVAYRADTGAEINTTWTAGLPFDFTFGVGEVLPGFDEGLVGMKVGGRRQVVIPFEKAFGPGGSEGLGLPPSTDLIVVIDLVGTY
jgi:peptidylprolyl isomerase